MSLFDKFGGDSGLKKKILGRIFIFTERATREDFFKVKEIFTDLGFGEAISEIRIDQKPYLKEIMTKESGNQESNQIFINSKYFGTTQTLISCNKEELKEKLKKSLNENPGELYNVYKKQVIY
jgi:hypothetical protein